MRSGRYLCSRGLVGLDLELDLPDQEAMVGRKGIHHSSSKVTIRHRIKAGGSRSTHDEEEVFLALQGKSRTYDTTRDASNDD